MKVPLFLSAADKLAALQAQDRLRTWDSLRDVRVCLLCGEEISGEALEAHKGRGREVIFRCPTPGCTGSLPQFVRPGNPLLEDASWRDWMLALGEDSAPADARFGLGAAGLT